MDFGLALQYLKQGHKIQRAGWNGKGLWVYMVTDKDFADYGTPLFRIGSPLYNYNLQDFMVIKYTNNTLSTWVPSIGDVMAVDWQVLE